MTVALRSDGHWDVAREHEVLPQRSIGIASEEERRRALLIQSRTARSHQQLATVRGQSSSGWGVGRAASRPAAALLDQPQGSSRVRPGWNPASEMVQPAKFSWVDEVERPRGESSLQQSASGGRSLDAGQQSRRLDSHSSGPGSGRELRGCRRWRSYEQDEPDLQLGRGHGSAGSREQPTDAQDHPAPAATAPRTGSGQVADHDRQKDKRLSPPPRERRPWPRRRDDKPTPRRQDG